MPTTAEILAEIQDVASPQKAEYDAAIALGSDQGVADAMNLPRTNTIWRNRITRVELFTCIDWAEVTLLTVQKAMAFNNVMMQDIFDASIPNNRTAFVEIFGPTSDTVAQMEGIGQKTDASRAEYLWGENTRITPTQVAEALGRI